MLGVAGTVINFVHWMKYGDNIFKFKLLTIISSAFVMISWGLLYYTVVEQQKDTNNANFLLISVDGDCNRNVKNIHSLSGQNFSIIEVKSSLDCVIWSFSWFHFFPRSKAICSPLNVWQLDVLCSLRFEN